MEGSPHETNLREAINENQPPGGCQWKARHMKQTSGRFSIEGSSHGRNLPEAFGREVCHTEGTSRRLVSRHDDKRV